MQKGEACPARLRVANADGGKELVEARGTESGGWRGEVDQSATR